MKYLVLFLSLFMVSNVNAEVSLGDFYLSLSYQQKELNLRLCRLENFPKNTTNKIKGIICMSSFFYTLDKADATKEYNSARTKKFYLEACRYLVKAGNFLFPQKNEVADAVDLLIHKTYDDSSCHISTTSFCTELKGYKGLRRVR